MKKRIVRTLVTVLVILLDLFIVGLLVREYLTTKTVSQSSLFRAGLILAGSALSLAKLFVQREIKRTPKTYRETYGDLIGNAFWNDKKAEALFCRALDAYNASLYSTALKRLERLSEQAGSSDDRFTIAVFSALCYDDMKQPKQAIVYYQQALLYRENSTVYSNMGISYRNLGNAEKALDAYEEAIKLDPSNAYPYNNAANLLIDQGDYEAALSYAQKATEINQRFRQAYTAQAICHAMRKNTEQYEIAVRKAVACGENRQRLETVIASLSPMEATDE